MDLDEVLNKVGDKFVSELRRTLRAEGHYATGETEKSIYKEVNEGVLRVYASSAVIALSGGRKPSQKNPSANMVDRVMRWMRAKGMQPLVRNKKGQFRKRQGYSARQTAAFAVSRGILRKGYKGSDIIKRSYDKLRSVIGDDIMDYFEKEVDNELKKIRFTDGNI